jgi:hypothetical protein
MEMRSSAVNGSYCIVILTTDVWLHATQNTAVSVFIQSGRDLNTCLDAELLRYFL